MTRLTIKAKSSGVEPYNVDFLVDNGRFSVFCNCQAGKFGKLCKHKTELIAGDESRLFGESEKDKMAKLMSILSGTDEVQSQSASIAQSEKLIRQEQSKLKKLKKQLALLLHEGIVISE